MELTVQNVYGLLLRSKLLPVEAARTMYARWQDEAKGAAGDIARFAAWMVANGYVTEYQASLLARGHANGFFLGEYTILERLGKGRMAGVYKARHRLGQTVAIKVLPPSRARDTMLLARFQREARLAVRLGHSNIVRAFQVGQEDDLHYLVMEHLEGATLEDVLETKKRLLPAEAVRIVYQALSGLAHIHEQGLVHRDLKPSNLMLVPASRENSLLDCTVKILDIGLGRALFEEGAEPADSGLTSEGVLLGTPDYMAPEQARDPRAADIRSDIYSLGCVLYHALAGRTPYPDTNIISQMIRHATEAPRPLRDFNTAIPDGLQQIVNWMMAKDPAGRYPTPQRAAQALEVFLAAGSMSASSPDLDPQMKSYLRWLEGKQGEAPSEQPDGKSAGPGPANVPTMPIVSLPSSTPPPAPEGPPAKPKSKPIVPAPRSDRPSASERSGRHKKKRPPPPVVQQEVVAQGEERVDVELLPMPPPVVRTAGRPAGGLTRRDLVMFFAGVGSGLAAYAVGRAFAGLLDRPRPVEQD